MPLPCSQSPREGEDEPLKQGHCHLTGSGAENCLLIVCVSVLASWGRGTQLEYNTRTFKVKWKAEYDGVSVTVSLGTSRCPLTRHLSKTYQLRVACA